MNDTASDGNRRRSRKRGSGRGKGSDGAGNKNRGRAKGPKVDPARFWGGAATLPRPQQWRTSTPDVTAVVSSLGRPPVPGHETPAEHWFSLVYERAAVLAGALAAAGGLDGDDNGVLGSDVDPPDE